MLFVLISSGWFHTLKVADDSIFICKGFAEFLN